MILGSRFTQEQWDNLEAEILLIEKNLTDKWKAIAPIYHSVQNGPYWSAWDSFNGDNGSMYGWRHDHGYSIDVPTNTVTVDRLNRILRFKNLCIEWDVPVTILDSNLLVNDNLFYMPSPGHWWSKSSMKRKVYDSSSDEQFLIQFAAKDKYEKRRHMIAYLAAKKINYKDIQENQILIEGMYLYNPFDDTYRYRNRQKITQAKNICAFAARFVREKSDGQKSTATTTNN